METRKKSIRRALPYLIFFLVLVLTLSTSSSALIIHDTPFAGDEPCCDFLEIDPEAVIADGEGYDVYIDEYLSAGSWIPVTVKAGHPAFPNKLVLSFKALTFLNDFSDAQGRWILKSPSGKVYEQDVKIELYSVVVGGVGMYLVVADDPQWHVPVLPQQGGWKLAFYVWDTALIFIERNIELIVFHFTVGESTFAQQLTAPFYFYFGGMTFGWGAFGFVIPCFLLIVLTPAWIVLVLLIVKIWKGWALLGAREIRKIKPKRDKKTKNGGKGNEKENIGYYG